MFATPLKSLTRKTTFGASAQSPRPVTTRGGACQREWAASVLAVGAAATRLSAAWASGGGEATGVRSCTPAPACYPHAMEMFRTALGRLVPIHETQTVLEDSILQLLYGFRMNPQNPDNAFLALPRIVSTVSADEALVVAALDGLREVSPPLVEQAREHGELLPQEKRFRITGSGVRFIRNLPQGLAGLG